MSEKMMRVKLSDLKTFRISCKKCGWGVVEVSIDRLHAALGERSECRLCGHEMFAKGKDGRADPLNDIKIAIALLADAPLEVSVDIPFPD